MSDLLIQKATIINPGGIHNGKVRDILIKKGKIAEIKTTIKVPAKIKKLNGKEPTFHQVGSMLGYKQVIQVLSTEKP